MRGLLRARLHNRGERTDHSPRATAFLERIERGALKVRLLDTVIFKTISTLQSFYHESPEAIRDNLSPLLQVPGIVLPRGRRVQNRLVVWLAGHPIATRTTEEVRRL